MSFTPYAALEAGLETIRRSPKDEGRLELIVRRPAVDAREVVEIGELDLVEGLVGDSWATRTHSPSGDPRAPQPDKQLTLMNAHVAALVAGGSDGWERAGDQLFVNLDLSCGNLPHGSRLAIGSAVVEITPAVHRGCKKFAARYGDDALRFVNSDLGAELNLRGVNAKVVAGGAIRTGDVIRKL